MAVADVERLLVMGSEPTAVDRIDAIRGRLEEYFENPGAVRVFRDDADKYKRGPARVISEAVVKGLKPREFKDNVEAALKLTGNWKDEPDALFEVVQEAAVAWRVVERADTMRRARGKPVSGETGGPAPSVQPTRRQSERNVKCWTCGEQGHRSPECPSGKKKTSGESGGDAGKSTARPPGHHQRGPGAPQNKGTPAAKGGSQQKPAAAQGAPVGGRAAVPAGDRAQGGGPDSSGIPPNPLLVVGAALTGSGADKVGAIVSSWRAVAPDGASAFMADGV